VRSSKTGRIIHQLFFGRLVAENGKIKLLRESINLVELALGVFPNGLADSPAGQLAWIYDKFHDWTDSHGDPENVLTKDEILDDVMLYWLPDTAASSARFYWENTHVTLNMGPVEKIPVACSIFPHEIYRTPRRWAEQTYKQLIYWRELDRGGHFAALEQPEIFVNELRAAFHQPVFREHLA
jgi:epoxide hydrolase